MLVHQPDLLARQMTALAELCALGWVHSSGGERRCQWSLVPGRQGVSTSTWQGHGRRR